MADPTDFEVYPYFRFDAALLCVRLKPDLLRRETFVIHQDAELRWHTIIGRWMVSRLVGVLLFGGNNGHAKRLLRETEFGLCGLWPLSD